MSRGRRLSPQRQAISDQLVAILRNAEGFPLSTSAICKELGQYLAETDTMPMPPDPRPPCWPDDVVDHGRQGYNPWCHKCRKNHRPPVWRSYTGQDVRGLLNRLEKDGEVEKIVIRGVASHYWRREDTDR